MPETPASLTLAAGSLLDRPLPPAPRRRWWILPLLLILAGSGWLSWRYIRQQRTVFTYRYDAASMPLIRGNLDSLLPAVADRVDSFAAYTPGVVARFEADDSQSLIGRPDESRATTAVAGATASFTSQASSITVAAVEMIDEPAAATAMERLAADLVGEPGGQLLLRETYSDLGDGAALALFGPAAAEGTAGAGLSFRLRLRLKNALLIIQGEIHDGLPAAVLDADGRPAAALIAFGQNVKERVIRLAQRLVAGAADYVPAVTAGIDSDADGLTDEREIEFHTNRNWPDTDGDGFPDTIELENGYNPLSIGGLVPDRRT